MTAIRNKLSRLSVNNGVILVLFVGVLIAGWIFSDLPELYLLATAAILVGILGILYFAFSLKKFVLLVLIFKPIIDLTWRWRFLNVADQGVNPQSLVGPLLIIVTTVAFILRKKHRFLMDWRLILLLSFASLAVLISPTSWGVNELVRLFTGAAIFFSAGYILRDESTFLTFTKYFIPVLCVIVFLAFLQRLNILPYEYWDWINNQWVGRVSGTYQHPLSMIYYLIYAVPLALYLIYRPGTRMVIRLLLWLFLGVVMAALALTYHRTALMAFGLAILLWMILTKKYHWVILMLLAGILLVFFMGDELRVLYANIFDILSGKIELYSRAFLRGRGHIWYLFLNTFQDSPLLLQLIGHGGSEAEGLVPGFGYLKINEPHNDFLRILFAYGVIGLILYISLIMAFLNAAFHLRRHKDYFHKNLGNFMIVVIAMILLLSLTNQPMLYPSAALYFYAFGSTVMFAVRLDRKTNL